MKEILYHWSYKIVKKPLYGVGKSDNDHGSGFYTAKDIEKAKEWALANGTDKAICNKYEIDTSNADIIVGYRADDSYITVVEAFLRNELSIAEVCQMFHKGNLGQQVFIKSPQAFDSLTFKGYEEIEQSHQVFLNNSDIQARREISNFINKRAIAIQINGSVPTGITAREAVNNDFVYTKDYSFYMPATTYKSKEEKKNISAKSKKNNKKGEKHEPEL